MSKLYLLFFLFLFTYKPVWSQTPALERLHEEIDRAPIYDKQKKAVINKIKKELKPNTPLAAFNKYRKLYEQYKEFKYDSAYAYTRKMFAIAKNLNNDSLYNFAKISQSYVLLTAGMLKEAFDSLETISDLQLDAPEQAQYFTLMARCYYALADYDNDQFHTPKYNKAGHRYLDSALRLYPVHSFQYLYYSGLKYIRSSRIKEAANYFNRLMADSTLTLHQIALTTSTLSDIYIRKREDEKAIDLLVNAAIADIKSSTKETTAAFNLSTILFRQGNLEGASFFIRKAMKDAVFYGARQRKMELSDVLSLIESERISQVEKESHKTLVYAIVLSLFILLLIALLIIVWRQIRKLKAAQRTITIAHHHLQEINAKLTEASIIKEEYIGYFFNGNSEIYSKVERFKRKMEDKVRDHKLSEVLFLINNFNLKQDKDELLKNFDRIFLKLFPNFIAEYNDLFAPEDCVVLKDDKVLNTDLRIFALIRLGIHENEKIAQILGYSINTINTYKTRVKNCSSVSNEDFEPCIMEIKSI